MLKRLNKKISDAIDMTETEDEWSAASAKRSIDFSIDSKIMALSDPTYESAAKDITETAIEKIAETMLELAKTISNPFLTDAEKMQKYPMIPSYLNTFDLGVLRALTLSACFDIVYKNWTTQFPEKKPAIADYSKIKDAKLHLSILRTAVLNQTSKRLNPAHSDGNPYKREKFELKLRIIVNNEYGAITEPSLSATPTPDTNYLHRRELQTKALQLAQEDLMAKYNIAITTDEVIAYVQEKCKITEEEFKRRRKNMEPQLAAVAAVVEGSMTPEKAAETYLKPINLEYEMLDKLKKADKKLLDEMRRTLPNSPQDLIINDLDRYWRVVEREKIAPFLIPQQSKENSTEFKSAYKRALLEYAKVNLLGKHPDLQNASPQDIGLQ